MKQLLTLGIKFDGMMLRRMKVEMITDPDWIVSYSVKPVEGPRLRINYV